jgi:hypothetical protein
LKNGIAVDGYAVFRLSKLESAGFCANKLFADTTGVYGEVSTGFLMPISWVMPLPEKQMQICSVKPQQIWGISSPLPEQC